MGAATTLNEPFYHYRGYKIKKLLSFSKKKTKKNLMNLLEKGIAYIKFLLWKINFYSFPCQGCK